MNYKQILKLDYEQLTYDQFIYTCVKNSRKPFRIMKFNSTLDRTTLVILSKTMNDNVATRNMTFTRSGAENVLKMFKNDFANIEIEELDPFA